MSESAHPVDWRMAQWWGRHSHQRISTHNFPPAVLALVDERLGGRYCVACRRSNLVTPPDVPLEIDHMQPLSKGGDNHHSNLQWLCRDHNRGRGNRHDPPAIPKFARGLRRG